MTEKNKEVLNVQEWEVNFFLKFFCGLFLLLAGFILFAVASVPTGIKVLGAVLGIAGVLFLVNTFVSGE